MMQPPPDDAALLREMKRTNKTPLFIGLGVIALILVGSGLWVLSGFAAVRSTMKENGYTNLKVSVKGPFTYSFSGRKGTSTCAGTVTRFPGSVSTEEFCVADLISTPPPNNRAEVEGSLKRNYEKDAFDTYSCPDIQSYDQSVTCIVSASNGASVEVRVDRKTLDTDGSWGTWSMEPKSPVANAEKVAADLKPDLQKALQKKRPGATLDVDCGKGPLVFVDNKASCKVMTHEAKPKDTTVAIELDKDRNFKWTITW